MAIGKGSNVDQNGYGSIPMKIPFLGEWTSINPSYFDVNYRGTIGFDTLPKWWKKTNWWSTYFSTKTVKAWWILLISAPQDVLSTPQIAVRLSAEVQPAALCHLLGHTFRQWPGTLIFFYPGGMVDHNGYEWLVIAIYVIYIYVGIIRV